MNPVADEAIRSEYDSESRATVRTQCSSPLVEAASPTAISSRLLFKVVYADQAVRDLPQSFPELLAVPIICPALTADSFKAFLKLLGKKYRPTDNTMAGFLPAPGEVLDLCLPLATCCSRNEKRSSSKQAVF